MDSILGDVRLSLRSLVRARGTALVALITLAIGIGANTAIASFAYSLLIRPLPFPNPDSLVAIWDHSSTRPHNEVALANFLDWRGQAKSFEHLDAYRFWTVNLTGVERAERIQGFQTTAGLLHGLGLAPLMGRLFSETESEPGQDKVAILSHGLWQRRFGSDAGVIGRAIQLNGVERLVVGVLPPSANFPQGADVLVPLALTPELKSNRVSHSFLAVGRLKRGVTLDDANAELATLTARLAVQYPESNTALSARAYPLLADLVRDYRPGLTLLMGTVAFVLLIACANLANIQLSRLPGRAQEMAVRASLGASRRRLVRLLLVESVVLSVVGGVIGLCGARAGVPLLKSLAPPEAFLFVPGMSEVGINAPILGFTLALTLATGVLFGLIPALQGSRVNLTSSLHQGGRTAPRSRGALRQGLVAAQVALALVLLSGAGFTVRAFGELMALDPGFEGNGVLTLGLSLPSSKYPEGARQAFFDSLLTRARALPNIEAVGMVSHLPLGDSNSSKSFLVEGQPAPGPGQEPDTRYRVCTPDYFRAMRIRVTDGRAFSSSDVASGPPVAIINQAMARQFFPQGGAVGAHLRFAGPMETNPWMEIVGIVANVRHELSAPATPETYVPHAQSPWATMFLTVRTTGSPADAAPAIRAGVEQLDRDQPVFAIRPMEEVKKHSVGVFRVIASMLGMFGGTALLLAGVGIFGAVSFAVSARRHEIGVRMALGARNSEVIGLVMRQNMRTVVAGAAIGLIAASGLGLILKSAIPDAGNLDPMALLISSSLLFIVAGLATWLPARTAASLPPTIALRNE